MEEKDESRFDGTDLNDVFDERKDGDSPRREEPSYQEGYQPTEKTEFPEPTPNKKKASPLKIAAAVVGSVIIAGISFVGGVLVNQAQVDDEMRSLINLKKAIQSYYYKEISDDEFYKVVFDAVERGILDQYSQYLSADELEQRLTEAGGKYIGIGIAFYSTTVTENGLYVNKVSGNSPAEAAGMKSGAYLTGYGQTRENIIKLTSFDAFDEFISAYGENQPFYIEFKNPLDAQSKIVEVSRQAYVENYVYYRAKSSAYSFTGEDALTVTPTENYLTELPETAAYIELTQFNGSAAEQFGKAMDKFKAEGKKDLILDLRDNGGGYSNILCAIASYFTKATTESNPIVAVAKYRDGTQESFTATGNLYDEYFSTDSNVYVLANDNSASASECLLGAMIDYEATSYANVCLIEKDGVAKTYGKGIMQSMFYLTLFGERDAVTLTTATMEWPKGNCIHGVGVTKDNGTKTVADLASGEDELKAALLAWGLN